MTKKEIKDTQKLINSLKDQIDRLEDTLHLESKSTVANTNLENRNYDVMVCRNQLYMTYDQIANALGITVAQVGESLKVLRDKGLVTSTRKAPTLIDDYLDDVKKLSKKKYSRARIAKELGISQHTVLRCQERLND